jgi:site-specific DNA-methyltransferase (adenine-specific)
MEALVSACGKSVLDPFMGSGTTGVAAVGQGKDFFGIEISEHYHRVAVERLKSVQR